jgi:hypothetical protein
MTSIVTMTPRVEIRTCRNVSESLSIVSLLAIVNVIVQLFEEIGMERRAVG